MLKKADVRHSLVTLRGKVFSVSRAKDRPGLGHKTCSGVNHISGRPIAHQYVARKDISRHSAFTQDITYL
jgi:hypothetical protein